MKINYQKLEKKRKILLLMKKMIGNKIIGIKYAEGKLVSAESGNEWIKNQIISGVPFMASRFGETEMNAIMLRERNIGMSEERLQADIRLCNNAGFFPCDSELVDKYSQLFIEAIKDIDLMGIWLFVNNEEYMIKKYMKI